MAREKPEEILPPLEEDDKMWSGLCYPFWFIFSPWTLKTDKKDKDLFIYFHALQGLYYGIFTSVITFISFLIVYLIFFRGNVQGMTEAGGKPVDQLIFWGSVGIIIMIVFLLFMFVVVFMTLYYGWKAASGKMFRIPFLGKKAWDLVYAKKERLEAEYYNTMGRRPEEAPGSFAPEGQDLRAPLSLEPGVNFAMEIDQIERGKMDLDSSSLAKPTVERIKSIFRQQEEVEFLEEEISPLEEEEEPVQEAPHEEERPLTPLEKLAALRRKQTEQEEAPPPPEPPHMKPEPPVEKQQVPKEKIRQPMSPLEQLTMLRKLQKKKEEIIEIPREPSPVVSAPAEEAPLSPLEQLSRMRKKQHQEEAQEDLEEIEIPRARPTSFLSGVDFSAVNPAEPAPEMDPGTATRIMSPLEQLAKRQKEREGSRPFVTPEEKTLRIKSFMNRMEKWSTLSGQKADQENGDDIF